MVDVRGDVLRPPHGTTPAAVKSNIKSEMRSFKSKGVLRHFEAVAERLLICSFLLYIPISLKRCH